MYNINTGTTLVYIWLKMALMCKHLHNLTLTNYLNFHLIFRLLRQSHLITFWINYFSKQTPLKSSTCFFNMRTWRTNINVCCFVYEFSSPTNVTSIHSLIHRVLSHQTDRHWTKWSLCAAMLRRRHNNTFAGSGLGDLGGFSTKPSKLWRHAENSYSHSLVVNIPLISWWFHCWFLDVVGTARWCHEHTSSILMVSQLIFGCTWHCETMSWTYL